VADRSLTGAVVPDTSVVLKWYLHVQEPNREQAMALLQAHLKGEAHLLVPELLPYEVANVLRYKPDWDAARVGQALESLLNVRLEIVPLSVALLQRAVILAYDYDVAVYEAAFVALAEGSGAVFVTADERLAGRMNDVSYIRSLGDLR
jgi:predicted nucleic acid-binding protein